MEDQSTSSPSWAAHNLPIADIIASQGIERLLYDEAAKEEHQGAALYKGSDVPISAAYKAKAMVLMQQPYAAIEQWLDTAEDDCGALREIIKATFNTFYAGPAEEITYRRVLYLGGLLQQLEAIKMTGIRKVLHGPLQKMLKQQNLNTEDYYNYCTDRYSKILDNIPEAADKLTELKSMRKRLLNLEMRGVAYHLPLRDIRHQLMDWVRTEIALVEKQVALQDNVKDRKQQADADFKMNALTTSETFGLFLKVIMKADIFRKVPREAFLRFATRYFSTTNNETLNFSTLRSRYHGKKLKALDEVSDMIHRMLRVVGEMQRRLAKKK